MKLKSMLSGFTLFNVIHDIRFRLGDIVIARKLLLVISTVSY